MRAFSLQSEKKLDEAAKLLEPYTGRYPQAAMMRMEINVSLQRLEEARSDARLVRTHMEDRTRREENLTAQDYAAWTIAEGILGDTAQAHELAEKWSALAPENKIARQILLEQKLRLFDSMLRLPEPDMSTKWQNCSSQAAQLNDNPQVLQLQLASLYRLRSESRAAQRVVDAVVNLPETPATLLEAAGTVAATMGEPEKAKEYLQRAVKKESRQCGCLEQLCLDRSARAQRRHGRCPGGGEQSAWSCRPTSFVFAKHAGKFSSAWAGGKAPWMIWRSRQTACRTRQIFTVRWPRRTMRWATSNWPACIEEHAARSLMGR